VVNAAQKKLYVRIATTAAIIAVVLLILMLTSWV